MSRILQVNISSGGVPTPAVAFGRGIDREGRKIFAGYFFAAENSDR